MPLTMNPEVRALWCAALRRGGYAQGRNRLATRHQDGTVEWCCLGVLCDLADKHGVISETGSFRHDGHGSIVFDGANVYLPASVAAWAGLSEANPVLRTDPDGPRLASGLNDSGSTFAEIADLIDGGDS